MAEIKITKISGNIHKFETACSKCRKNISFTKIVPKLVHVTYICPHCKTEITEVFDLDEYNTHVGEGMQFESQVRDLSIGKVGWKMKMLKHIRSGKKCS